MKKHAFQKFDNALIQKMRATSVYRRVRTLAILLVLFIFTCLIFLVIQSIRDNLHNLSFETSEILNSAESSLQQDIRTLDTVTKLPVYQNSYGTSTIYRKLSKDPGTWDDDYSTNSKIQEEIEPMYELNPNIQLISFIDRKSVYFYCYRDAMVYHLFQGTDDYFQEIAAQAKGSLVILNQSDQHHIPMEMTSNCIYGVRALMSLVPHEMIGTALCCIDTTDIVDDFIRSRSFDKENIYCFDKTGTLILSSSTEEDTVAAEIASTLTRTDIQEKLLKTGSQYFVYYSTVSASGISCVVRIPFSCILGQVLYSKIPILIAIGFSLILVLIFIRSMVMSIVTPVRSLTEACNNMKNDNLDQIIDDSDASDEVHDLIISFNNMSERISYLVNEVYSKENLLAKTELQLLRSQINPHFMYNTLETIRARADLNNDSVIAEMATILGNILRYGVSNSSSIVSIKDIKTYIANYTRLYRLHYGDKIQINCTFSEELNDKYMLKLLIEPLIENSIYHGFDDFDHVNILDIIGYIDYNTIIIKVSDNGKGMKKETVDAINDYINDRNKDFSSIGLRNVNKRIKIFYGEEYGVQVNAVWQRGTMVTISVPVIDNDNLREYEQRTEQLHSQFSDR